MNEHGKVCDIVTDDLENFLEKRYAGYRLTSHDSNMGPTLLLDFIFLWGGSRFSY